MKDFIEKIKKHKEDVHLRSQYFNSSVLICLQEEEGELNIILEKRASSLRRQPGEICFPGGKIEKEEWEHPEKTALRETVEELGVREEEIELLGPMNHLVNNAGVLVYSFIGLLKEEAEMKLQSQEVERILKIPISYFVKHPPKTSGLQITASPTEDFPLELIPERYKEIWENRVHHSPIYFYEYEGEVIWGLTASLIYEFVQLFAL